jgi:hypothetical protein
MSPTADLSFDMGFSLFNSLRWGTRSPEPDGQMGKAHGPAVGCIELSTPKLRHWIALKATRKTFFEFANPKALVVAYLTQSTKTSCIEVFEIRRINSVPAKAQFPSLRLDTTSSFSKRDQPDQHEKKNTPMQILSLRCPSASV